MAAPDSYLDASEVLAAALEQMDDIIAATTLELQNGSINDNSYSSQHSISTQHSNGESASLGKLIKDLSKAIKNNVDDNDNNTALENLDHASMEFLLHWLLKHFKMDKPNIQNGDFDEMQEKVHRMETDRENLLLQVSVLTEQVEAQNEKIGELENLILNKKSQLTNAEELLQQEIISRSNLESNKLEIMTEMSNLRLKLTSMERDRRETEEKCRKTETELVLLHAQLAEKEAELATLRTKLIKNEPKSLSDDAQKLKRALDSIAEKDKKIEELKMALNKCKKLQDLVLSGQGKKEISPSTDKLLSQDYRDSPFPSTSAAEILQKLSPEPKLFEKPPPVPRHNTSLVSTPLPSDPSPSSWREINITKSSPSPSPICSVTDNSPVPPMKLYFQRSNSAEDISQQPQKTPPVMSQYGTIPRQHGADVLQQLQQQLQQHDLESGSVPGSNNITSQQTAENTCNSSEQTGKKESFQTLHHPSLGQFRPIRGKSSGVSFGKGFFKLRKGKRSSSAPELAQQESVIPETELDSCQSALSLPVDITPIVMPKEKNKGLKKIFGKWKRSGSHSLDRGEGEFKRGGVRATAGPRLGWSKDLINDPDLPFPRWNTEMIVEWLHRMGLSMYVGECKRWVKNGEHLLKATSHEIEKEIGIKNTLHRKKLQLALRTVNPEGCDLPESANKWDFHWVVRWLDDIGLPQYKDAFVDARVDGRMLHFLTVDDLLALKVSNQLHHISIKRGIQILREKKFDLHCLIRRSLPEESKVHTPQEVALWTNHRVMEWLRTVDLSEYAPNLRGSGVHGALMVYEPRFNADLLASVLNIPPTKTLLRRHLTTHFKEVVGSDLMQQKREQETQSGYMPLTPSSKVKAIRKSQFGLKKKRGKGEEDYEEYICPMDISSNNSGKQEKTSERHSDPLPRTEGNEVLFQEGKNLSSMSSTNV